MAFSQLRADPAAVGEDRAGKGLGVLLLSRAQAALRSLGLLVCSVRYLLGAGVGPCSMGEMVLRKRCEGVCAPTCVCFLSCARFLSFCCPKVTTVEVAVSGAVLWILGKAITGEGRMSLKSVVRLFCAAVSTSPSPRSFLPNSQRANELPLSVPANEARILGP